MVDMLQVEVLQHLEVQLVDLGVGRLAIRSHNLVGWVHLGKVMTGAMGLVQLPQAILVVAVVVASQQLVEEQPLE